MSQKLGLGLVLGTALISGFSIFLNSYAVKGFDSSVFTFAKNLVVAVALFAILFGTMRWQEVKQLKVRHWRQLAVIGLVGGSIPFLLFFKGLQMASGQMGSFIHKSLFVFVAILAPIFLKEKPAAKLVWGTLLLLAGNYLLIRPAAGFSVGHLLILAAAILWAIENVYAKYVLRELPGTVVAFGRMAFGSVFIFIFLLMTDKADIVWNMSPAQYGWIGVTSLLLLGYVLTFYNGLREIPVTVATGILPLGSPVPTHLACAVQGAPLQALQLFGVLVIVGGVAAIAWMPRRHPAAT